MKDFIEQTLEWFKRNGGKVAMILLLCSELLAEGCLPLKSHSLFGLATSFLREHAKDEKKTPKTPENSDDEEDPREHVDLSLEGTCSAGGGHCAVFR